VIDSSYSRLGDLLASLATDRHAGDPRTIAERIVETTGHEVSDQEISNYLCGARCPGPKFMRAFADAFSLSAEESRKLAWIYTFSKPPD
jgi:hypothetical protein